MATELCFLDVSKEKSMNRYVEESGYFCGAEMWGGLYTPIVEDFLCLNCAESARCRVVFTSHVVLPGRCQDIVKIYHQSSRRIPDVSLEKSQGERATSTPDH